MLNSIYSTLYAHYGPQHWWPADSSSEILIGAVLTQNTRWQNVQRTIAKLDGNLTFPQLLAMESTVLQELIRPSGFMRSKSQTIQSLARWMQSYDFDFEQVAQNSTDSLRQQLLDIKGIGEETADSILLYAFNRPLFVVDSYFKRLWLQLGLPPQQTYRQYQQLVMQMLPVNSALYQEFHALIVQYGKDFLTRQPTKQRDPLQAFRAAVT